MRSSIGISNLSVSEEIDPGFGPDTEQRRVEFASKLEEEAFSISVGDATTLARSNLITALKLWDKKNLIKLVNDLDLYDIMLIWIIFDICYILQTIKLLSKSELEKVLLDKKNWGKFVRNMLKSLGKDISRKVININIKIQKQMEIREGFGGDLIFSLKNKNIYEIHKIFEMTYSKLSQSLRDTFSNMISIVDIDFSKIKSVISTDREVLKGFILLVCNDVKSRYQLIGKKVEKIGSIIMAFNQEAGKIFLKVFEVDKSNEESDVQKQVNRYYGISSN